ncbi:MAG: sensor histidine kinase [Congregibacter sp.]
MIFFRRLYFRLALATGLLFVIVGGALITISTRTSELYSLETTQRLNRDIALHAAEDMPLLGPDGVNETALKELAHHVMFINPIVEVYLLDTRGNILSHALPSGTVLRDRVEMAPLQEFMGDNSKLPIFGDDPRSRDAQKAFSVSPILDAQGEVTAYLYTVLNGKTFDGIRESLSGSYNLRAGTLTIIAALCVAIVGGAILFFFLTRRLHRLARAVRAYREHSYQGEIDIAPREQSQDEIDVLGSAIKDMSTRIERQFDAQQEIDRNRRELIANVSHDLRTPVSSVQGFLETVLVKDLDASTQRDYLETAHKHCLRLNELIGELFELSTLESGTVEPQWEPFPVMELVQDIIHDHEIRAAEQGITLSASASDQGVQVYADIAMIHRALDNLIQNALKHTRSGGEISIRVNSHAQRVVVEVIDDGEGIASKDIAHIFERFYRPDTEQPAMGHGLGLAIVKRIVELHKSQIAVRSERNHGAEFSFWLPQPA